MIYPENRGLFTVSEAAHACGISRATLLRIEESGFLTPYRIDPDTGYRYYDAQNIATIGQYQFLQSLGLNKSEISDFYYMKTDIKDFLATQRAKINRLNTLLNELELRYTHSNNFKTSFVTLPETTCYCETGNNYTIGTAETFAYIVHHNAIKAGYQMRGAEPLFLYVNGLSDMFINEHPENEITVCIPIVTPAHTDCHIQTFPASQAFSILGYGDYAVLPELSKKFRQEILSNNIKPTGRIRAITHIATYSGTHISHDDFCYELVVPCETPI